MLDIGLVIAAIPVLVPVLASISVIVRVTQGSPVFFRQKRPGLHGNIFELWKFRTMTIAKNPDGELLPDSARLTRFGRFLRATSLDEIPEVFNILCGEMSLVGPRPLLVQYLDRYDSFQARRHEVLPGLTGWAQVNGRNAISWEQKFRLDVWYVENCSLWLDIKILVMTLRKVFLRHGINAADDTTMPEFRGANSEKNHCDGKIT